MKDIDQIGAAINRQGMRAKGRVSSRMKRASYRDAIAWIARNGDDDDQVAVALVAALFDVTIDRVDRDVADLIEKGGAR